jgi:CubicO group peptidase (beta-lactamase class C family)
MSAAVAKDGAVIWSRGFGFAHRERGIRADAGSIYQLASVTKPYASAVVLQLVEEGLLDLDAPVAAFGIDIDGGDAVRVRHLLSHTAGLPPGSHYHYDGWAFGELGRVIRTLTAGSFRSTTGSLSSGITDTGSAARLCSSGCRSGSLPS